jgi:pyridoxamine 5'-phosphate oxidase
MGSGDPIGLFQQWMAEATELEPFNPDAAALATTTAEGHPAVRMVLIKEVDERGFVFYTNSTSPTGGDIQATGRASLGFYWKSLRRQVRVDGTAAKVTQAESDAYFATRARSSQIGAWASKQSQPMEGRFELEKRIARYTAKFKLGPVSRPPFWEGYRIRPERIEFWRERQFRLHDRMVYIRRDDGAWETQRLFP